MGSSNITEDQLRNHVHTLSVTLDRRLEIVLEEAKARSGLSVLRDEKGFDQLVLKVATIHRDILGELANPMPLRRKALMSMLEMQLGALRLLDQIEAVRAKSRANELAPTAQALELEQRAQSLKSQPHTQLKDLAVPNYTDYTEVSQPWTSEHAFGVEDATFLRDASSEYNSEPPPPAARPIWTQNPNSSTHGLRSPVVDAQASVVSVPSQRSTARALTVVAPKPGNATPLVDMLREYARPGVAMALALAAGICISSFFFGAPDETPPKPLATNASKLDGRLASTDAPLNVPRTDGGAARTDVTRSAPETGSLSTNTEANPRPQAAAYVAVIGTVGQQGAAQEAVSALRAKHPALLLGSSREAGVQPVQREDGVVVYRAHLLPPLHQEAAKELCRRLREAGHVTCWVKPYSGRAATN